MIKTLLLLLIPLLASIPHNGYAYPLHVDDQCYLDIILKAIRWKRL